MERLIVFIVILITGNVQAQPSCFDSAKDRETFDRCAREEILPLESKVVHATNALRGKYRAQPTLLRALERSDETWNAYRNNHCEAEGALRGGKDPSAVRRAFAECTKRILEQRLRELEAL